MRILMTTDTVGGVWTYALELADALAERDAEVVLVALGSPLRPDQRRELRASRVARAYSAAFALEWMERPWRDVERSGEWLLEIADAVEPDLVHLNGYAHAALPFAAPAVVVGHSCVLSWHRAVRRAAAGPEWDRYADAVRRGFDFASLLVAPTRAMLDELVRLYEPPCPRRVVPNGRALRLPRVAKEPLVLAAGRAWDEAKNLQAVARLRGRLEWPVEVVGEGSALGAVPRRDLDRLLARASIFVAPARYEPFGLAALEAALAGCALVLGDIPSLREVWGDAAVFVAPDDHEALERAVADLIADAPRCLRLARQARTRAGLYTPERMADGYLAAYDVVRPRTAVAA